MEKTKHKFQVSKLMISELKANAQEILNFAGIKINGKSPWDIQVHNNRLYSRVLSEGSLGLGESYMEGWWDCEKLDEFFYKVLSAKLERKVRGRGILKSYIMATFFNSQNKKRSYEVGEKHYDIGNNLYKIMLDKRMVYTCGYWKDADNLDDAQEAKLDLVCKKLGFKAGMKVLDIGCGWGSFAKFAAEKYKVEVVGITISKEQVKLGNNLCKGLPVEIRLQDYRDVNEKFDRIVSLGMVEHVGPKNYRTFMKIVYKNLKDNGLFLLHTIGGNISVKATDKWINKYIFPNGVMPSAKQISASSEGLFSLEDWHNFGADYDKTLMAWYNNFSKGWEKIEKMYEKKFKRMWKYYLLVSAASFRVENNRLWQIVFSKIDNQVKYKNVR